MKPLNRVVIWILLCLCLCFGSTIWAQRGQRKQVAPPPITVKVGDVAPDFSLRSHELKDVKLSGFRGKKTVVLAFYVLAFTGG